DYKEIKLQRYTQLEKISKFCSHFTRNKSNTIQFEFDLSDMVMKNALLLLLLLLLLLPSSHAVPATRSHMMGIRSNKEAPASYSLSSNVIKGRRVIGIGEEVIGNFDVRGKMDMEEVTDYPDTGANDRHDPKTPRRG
ncbi:hypothetical protein LINGRAHAP2_LOCUS1272, partial [Linum grandiflorum]